MDTQIATPEKETKTPWISATGYVFQQGKVNVLEATLERIRHLFTLADTYVVSFSGGKDSTCVLMLSLQVARELGRLPLEVCYIDEEVIDPDTLEYIAQVREWPEVALRWFCVPIRHTLRAKGRSHWLTWDEREKAVWAREMPAWAITGVEGLDESSSYADVVQRYYLSARGGKNLVAVTGIRVQEAFNRRRGIILSGSYIHHNGRYILGKPIFDWKTEDVWKAIITFKWPHSRFYDRLWLKCRALIKQRVAPWGNVASSDEVRHYPEFYPDFWERAIKRLPELRAAARYGDTGLYHQTLLKPISMTWQEFTMSILEGLAPDSRQFWAKQIKHTMRRWANHSTIPFPDDDVGATFTSKGLSWKRFATMMAKNDRIKGGCRDQT